MAAYLWFWQGTRTFDLDLVGLYDTNRPCLKEVPIVDRLKHALLLENIHPDAAAQLTKAGYEVRMMPCPLGERELIDALGYVSLLGIRSQTRVGERVLASAPGLLAVGVFCGDANQIDLVSAAHHGVAVFNAPFSSARSVVELAIAEIISLARRLPEKNARMHAGQWDKSSSGAYEVRGQALGIVGYGNVGRHLSVLAESLGMTVYFYDVADKLAIGTARRCSSLRQLLETVDIVTLHVDGRESNRGFFGAAEFAMMSAGSMFLNLSRGSVVDYEALYKAIESKHIAGAAIDVFSAEPGAYSAEFDSRLRGAENVILTPHIGESTEQAQQGIGEFVATKLIDYISFGSTSLSCNYPEISQPVAPGTYRLMHLHQNVPGALATINRVLAEHEVNVESQLLRTRNDIGYVITDIDTLHEGEVLDKLRAMDTTIRLRMSRLGL